MNFYWNRQSCCWRRFFLICCWWGECWLISGRKSSCPSWWTFFSATCWQLIKFYWSVFAHLVQWENTLWWVVLLLWCLRYWVQCVRHRILLYTRLQRTNLDHYLVLLKVIILILRWFWGRLNLFIIFIWGRSVDGYVRWIICFRGEILCCPGDRITWLCLWRICGRGEGRERRGRRSGRWCCPIRLDLSRREWSILWFILLFWGHLYAEECWPAELLRIIRIADWWLLFYFPKCWQWSWSYRTWSLVIELVFLLTTIGNLRLVVSYLRHLIFSWSVERHKVCIIFRRRCISGRSNLLLGRR